MAIDPWLKWARSLQGIAQTGLHFSKDIYDRERYTEIADIAAEMISTRSPIEKTEWLAWNMAQVGYATPRVDVRTAVFRDDKLLMIREVMDHDRWTLPGGWCDVHDSPARAAERETWEETGFDVKAVKLIAVYDRDTQNHPLPHPYGIYKHYFLCEIIGGEAKTSHESSEVRFFSRAELDQLDLSEARVLHHQLHHCFEHHENRSLPTTFD